MQMLPSRSKRPGNILNRQLLARQPSALPEGPALAFDIAAGQSDIFKLLVGEFGEREALVSAFDHAIEPEDDGGAASRSPDNRRQRALLAMARWAVMVVSFSMGGDYHLPYADGSISVEV
jgi:hypothetical protein